MIRILLITILASLLFTEAVELSVAYLMGIRSGPGLMLVFLMNLLTNPAVVLLSVLIPAHTPTGFPLWPVLLALELAAWAAEALICRKNSEVLKGACIIRLCGAAGPWLFSAILNLLSFSAGLLFDRLAAVL